MSKRPATLVDGLARALLEAADAYDRGRDWPAAVLWPDPERHWTAVFEPLRALLKPRGVALYQLGDYAPDKGIGPAIWLRCLIDTDLLGASPAPGDIAVFLLPSISTAALRAPETLDRLVHPLVETQYRGEVFRHRRQARDWTLGPFLRSPDQGLGLDMAVDQKTDEAALNALRELLQLPLEHLPTRQLTAEDFNRLIVQDEIRDLLAWIADPDDLRRRKGDAEWSAFTGLIDKSYGLDLSGKGALQTALEKLRRNDKAWSGVNSRLLDNPQQWRNVCEQLRKSEPTTGFFDDPAPNTAAGTAHLERQLEHDLASVAELSHADACGRILELEQQHRERRANLWARLGEAPLAKTLEHLARLAMAVGEAVPGDDLTSLSEAYVSMGWRADSAMIDALASNSAHVGGPRQPLIEKVVAALYRPWAEVLTERFREAHQAAGANAKPTPPRYDAGTCVIFVDGLRMDLAQRLVERLDGALLRWRLSPIPTVTATAKPLITPVADAVSGNGKASDFLPLEASSGQPATTARLRNAMLARGIQVLEPNEVVGPNGDRAIGWTECGHVDKDGHSLGLRLAGQIDGEIERIANRVLALQKAGWPTIRVMTDHGWLLVPGNLPKVTIAASIVETAWSRVASLSGAAAPDANVVPWHFDDTVRIVVPPGISAYRAGEAYAHGGISPQECVIPDIIVGGAITKTRMAIGEIVWKRWKLTVTTTDDASGHRVELRRTNAAPVPIERETLEGSRIELWVDSDVDEETAVEIVLLDRQGVELDRKKSRVGERQ